MSGKNINFDDKKINRSYSYKKKKTFTIDDLDVNKILIFKKEPSGKKGPCKYHIGYDDTDYFGTLFIKLPQMSGYVKCFDGNKTMFFKVTSY